MTKFRTKHGILSEDTAKNLGIFAAFTSAVCGELAAANSDLFMMLSEIALQRLETEGFSRDDLKKALQVSNELSKSLDPQQEGTLQ